MQGSTYVQNWFRFVHLFSLKPRQSCVKSFKLLARPPLPTSLHVFFECPWSKRDTTLKNTKFIIKAILFKKNSNHQLPYLNNHISQIGVFFKKYLKIFKFHIKHKPIPQTLFVCMYIVGVKRTTMYNMQVGHPSRWPKKCNSHPPANDRGWMVCG
jgi:hypothetical protein